MPIERSVRCSCNASTGRSSLVMGVIGLDGIAALASNIGAEMYPVEQDLLIAYGFYQFSLSSHSHVDADVEINPALSWQCTSKAIGKDSEYVASRGCSEIQGEVLPFEALFVCCEDDDSAISREVARVGYRIGDSGGRSSSVVGW